MATPPPQIPHDLHIPTRPHGILRGLERTPSSPQFEGRFGRMFRSLPAARFTEKELHDLAEAMVAAPSNPETPEDAIPPDDEENTGTATDPGISAGYTYFGQFIDHDLTFDPASSLDKENDPDSLVDFRTPRFDLDSVYGRGPDDQPYLYQEDGVRMLLGRPLTGNPHDSRSRDLPRNSPEKGRRRALIGDPRNDENVIVSQLQSAFLRFHNRVADKMGATKPSDFPAVQRRVRWHYQWAVLCDFLPTILGRTTLGDILPHLAAGTTIDRKPADLRFFKWRNDPFIPVEFSAAAYRFGHSMVRPVYRLNTTLLDRQPIFSKNLAGSLVGFGEFPANWAIEWPLFFKMGNNPPAGSHRLQPAYKIDSSLVNPLHDLPKIVVSTIPNLAERNLLRGWRMGLPSGQAVARKMGVPVIPDDKLRVGKATHDDTPNNRHLTEISAGFKNNAPLWYYVLAEAQQAFQANDTPIRLGPVGGRIVGEVFVGLLLGDRHSFLAQEPCWKPDYAVNGRFGMAELINMALEA
jgi:hypothetical protein